MSKGTSATNLKSVQDSRKSLQKFLKALDEVPTEILTEEVPTLYAEIIAETPYDTGKLENSVRVSVARDKRRPGLNASASARSKGGYNYAGIQHDNTTFDHPIKGKANYVRDPFRRSVKRIKRRIRDELKKRRKA